MAADFDKGDEAKEIISRGTKEFSVLFSGEELEKMVSDGGAIVINKIGCNIPAKGYIMALDR